MPRTVPLKDHSNEAWQFSNPADGCIKCPELVRSRQNVVWSKGPTDATVLVIGEAPGVNEDIKRQPFVGRSGSDMDTMLELSYLNPREFHYANVVMCHPQDNRDPSEEEVANCSPWLTEHIRLVNPLAIIHLGAFSISTAFQKHAVKDVHGMMYRRTCDNCGSIATSHKHRRAEGGMWKKDLFGLCDREEEVRLRLHLATYHPASVFRQPANKAIIMHDLKRFRVELDRLKAAQ